MGLENTFPVDFNFIEDRFDIFAEDIIFKEEHGNILDFSGSPNVAIDGQIACDPILAATELEIADFCGTKYDPSAAEIAPEDIGIKSRSITSNENNGLDVIIYPNPTDGQFLIKSPGEEVIKYFSIINTLGEIVQVK